MVAYGPMGSISGPESGTVALCLYVVECSLVNNPSRYAPYHQPLVGRTIERDTLLAWLREEGPVVASIVGPGGVGKTHLAHVVARHLATELDADLTVLRLDNQTPESLPGYLAMRLGAPLASDEPDDIPQELVERRLVLLVDNCETVLPDISLTVSRLAMLPGVRIIATSQVPLNTSTERVLWLQPLGVESDLESDAVRLFLHHARIARPDFAIDEENAGLLNAILHELDGLPLAIVLAAAHVRHLPLDALLEQLREDITLLNGGPGDIPARHRSLRSAFATSLNGLSHHQHDLLLMLSWYRSGFGAGDVQELLPDTSRAAAWTLLEQLADRSLIRHVAGNRFGMLHIIQAMAHQRVITRPELAEHARSVHRTMLARVAAEAKTHMHGPAELAWRRRLHDLLPDVMATWDDPDPAIALRLIADMQWFWYTGAMYAPVLPRMEEVVTRGQGHDAAAGAHVTLGWMWHRLGEIDTAQRHFEEAIQLRSPDDPVRQLATVGLAYCLTFAGENIERGIGMFDDVIAAASRQDGVSHELVAAWFGKGVILVFHGDMELAQPCFLRALELAGQVDDFHALGMCLMHLAMINLAEGDGESALWKLQEAIPQILSGGDLATVALALDILASTLAAIHQPERAALALAHGERLRNRLGVVRSPVERQAIDELRATLPPLPQLAANTATGQILELLDTRSGKEAEAPAAAMLSSREMDVLQLTAQGYRGAEIAERLFISPNTVKRHMANIRSKLGVKSQAAAIATIREMSGSEIRR